VPHRRVARQRAFGRRSFDSPVERGGAPWDHAGMETVADFDVAEG
jgi:hypothetical protein